MILSFPGFCFVNADEKVSDSGPVEEQKDSIRAEPFSLPANFEWSLISLDDVSQVRENRFVCVCVCVCVRHTSLILLKNANSICVGDG